MNNLKNLFQYGHGQYSRLLQFEVLALIVLVITFITFVFKNTFLAVIVLLVFTLFMADMYVSGRTDSLTDFNKDTLLKLNSIQQHVHGAKRAPGQIQADTNDTNCLFYDATLIHFIHSIQKLFEYNPDEFIRFIKGVNNILRIRRDTEDFYKENGKCPENMPSLLQTCMQLKTNTINNLHNFVYSVPKVTRMNQYIDNILDRYNILISRNIDVVYSYYTNDIQQNGINNQTQFITYNNTKPFDAMNNHVITVSKGQNLNIQLPTFYT